MNHAAIILAAANVLATVTARTPTNFSGLPLLLTVALDDAGVPFEERRYVCMAVADAAEGKARALGGPSAKLLRKLASYAMDQHARWCGVRWYERRGPYEDATRAELDTRRAEQREIDGKKALIDHAIVGVESVVVQGVRAIEACGGFLPHTIDARTAVTVAAPTGGEASEAKKPREKKVGPDKAVQETQPTG